MPMLFRIFLLSFSTGSLVAALDSFRYIDTIPRASGYHLYQTFEHVDTDDGAHHRPTERPFDPTSSGRHERVS